MEIKSYSTAEVEKAKVKLMIESAAGDGRLEEIANAMMFRSCCPEGRIWEATKSAEIAEYYGLSPEEMQDAFNIYYSNIEAGRYE